jgi:putative DNA primase/helicase
MREPLDERARGRWHGILPQLGVPARFLNGKHQPCPICGGKDRARFDDKEGRGTFYCSVCGAGSGVHLVMKVNGWRFKEAAERIEAVMGDIPAEGWKPDRSEDQKRQAMRGLWRAALWLNARVGLTEFPPCLRHVDRMRYEDDPPSYHPGMVALVSGPDGRPVTLHRTYLTEMGAKAPVEAPRRQMPGLCGKGASVRLCPPAALLGVSEGIETALAASRLFGIGVWATMNAGLMAEWIPPSEAKEIVIFGDNDAKFGGQAAAYKLAHRLAVMGLTVNVEIPPNVGEDWNDVWLRGMPE